MSEDTEKRVEKFSEDNIFKPNKILFEVESLNKDYRDQGAGPYVNLAVETFSDRPFSTSPGRAGRREEGVIVYEIFDRKGSGKRTLSIIRDKIRNVFIDPSIPSKQRKLEPTADEQGQIIFYEVTQRPAVDVNRTKSRDAWRRLDVLVSYTKYYTVTT